MGLPTTKLSKTKRGSSGALILEMSDAGALPWLASAAGGCGPTLQPRQRQHLPLVRPLGASLAAQALGKDNFKLFKSWQRFPDVNDRAMDVLDLVGLTERCDHYPAQLSGGEQQRVAIARALVNDPGIILADEPTGNLDSANGEEVMKLLAELNEEGTTIIMVTHSPYDANYSHRIINLFDGKIVTENIKEQFHI